MRKSFGLGFVLASIAACGGTGAGGDDTIDPPGDADVDPQARGFRIVSTEIDIPANTEVTYCYYFRTPNTEPLAINKWKSSMTPGSHHMIMYTTTTDVMEPGTVSSGSCGLGTGTINNQPVWTYAAQTPNAEVALPTDDGNGMPLAQDIAPNTPGYFQMHYLNATDAAIKVHVELEAEALPAGAQYTKTAPYITYNDDIDIPPATNNWVETKTCTTPAGAKFWTVSTHAHKQAVKTEVMSGTDVAFASEDWEHPGTKDWMSAPFYTFANNQLTWSCTYNNADPSRTIRSGDSAETEEMCMATGYYFPASSPKFCYCPNGQTGCISL